MSKRHLQRPKVQPFHRGPRYGVAQASDSQHVYWRVRDSKTGQYVQGRYDSRGAAAKAAEQLNKADKQAHWQSR